MENIKSWSTPSGTWMTGSGYNIDLGDGYRLVGGLPRYAYYEDYYESCGTGTLRILKDGKKYIEIIFGNINCRGGSYRVTYGKDKLVSFSFVVGETGEDCYTYLKNDGKSTYRSCGASGWTIYRISIKFKTEPKEYMIKVDNAYAGTTKDGRLIIRDIPYGEHTFEALRDSEIVAKKTVLVDKDMTVTLDTSGENISKDVINLKGGDNVFVSKHNPVSVILSLKGLNTCGYPSCIYIEIDDKIHGLIKCHYGGWSDAIIPAGNWSKSFKDTLIIEYPRFTFRTYDMRKLFSQGRHKITLPDTQCQQRNILGSLTLIYGSV